MNHTISVLATLLFLGLSSPLGVEDLRTYDAAKTTGPVTVDGILDDPDWVTAPWTEEFADILGDGAPAPPLSTRAKLLWDQEYLYVGAELEEPHLWASLVDRDAIIYQDDDFEVFLDPDGDGLGYFEIEINAAGAVLDLRMNRPYNKGGKAEIGWNVPALQARVSLAGTLNDPSDTDRGWSVELAIPWAELAPPGRPPHPGESWRINFSRVDWPFEVLDDAYRKTETATRQNPHPENNWVWSPQGSINMHIPEMWGVVRFILDPQNSPFEIAP
jgi:hypothetical protein